MERLQIYCLSLLLTMVSCSERQWYQKQFTDEEKVTYAPMVRIGAQYYQGTVPEQFQVMEALRLDSTDAGTWREMGTARVKRGIADEMEYYYAEAVKRDPTVWAGFRGYLYLYFYRDFERAIADFDLGDEANGAVSYSQSQSHDYMRGICYYGLKDYAKALDQLDRYINKLVSEDGEEWVDVYAFLYKGLALEQLGKVDEAIVEYDRILKYYPTLSDAYYHKARIYQEKGQSRKALSEISQAETYFNQGYYHQRPYVEVLGQIYIQDIEELREQIKAL
ncbi:MAG: tetratricopeptide repeat protein [Bacteroidota bacterium]